MGQRKSGILLHITSLPTPFCVGDFGPSAYRFIDFLHSTGQSCWQVLPLTTVDGGSQYSPYSGSSAFAGNVLLISPEMLVSDGLLDQSDIDGYGQSGTDFDRAFEIKRKLLTKAYVCFLKNENKFKSDFLLFEKNNEFWLSDYALFVICKRMFLGAHWTHWPEDIKRRNPKALEQIKKESGEEIKQIIFQQFIFLRQWQALCVYADEYHVEFIGDVPIYVNYDSADVWAHTDIFKLNADLNLEVVSGVPPDSFSSDGQKWGNPVYNWPVLTQQKYNWWIKRMEHTLKMFDYVRLDHFRGFVQYWEIPAEHSTAIDGRWMDVPTEDFFRTLKNAFQPLPIIAEDLGIISDDVKEAMRAQGFAGMKVLEFAFDEDLKDHPYLPHNYESNCVAYTGTHDNNTVIGWWEHDATPKERQNVMAYIGEQAGEDIAWEFIKLAMFSKADISIIPLQDVLRIGQSGRMNKPGTVGGNWQWRLDDWNSLDSVQKPLKDLTIASQRKS